MMFDRRLLAEGFDALRVGLADELALTRPHLFSAAELPVPAGAMRAMGEIVAAIERVVSLPAWQERALAEAPPLARAGESQPRGHGVFFGYDFHLTSDGPRLIEINTNAGGALLNLLLLRAWGREDEAQRSEDAIVAMLRAEWAAVRGLERPLQIIALVDETPAEQYLYPEFLLFQALCRRHGIDCLICDPRDLLLCHGRLWLEETPIDLIYNRLTDFYFAAPMNAVLKQAWLDGSALITPHPRAHALFADKRLLAWLSDGDWLAAIGVEAATRDLLARHVPATEVVAAGMDAAQAEALWLRRKGLFFKPLAGFGARGAYRGDGLTRRVFDEILQGGYVAQAFAPASTLTVPLAAGGAELKCDLRCFVYRGEVQLCCARLWQGQTTNFRTPGGGFAAVKVGG